METKKGLKVKIYFYFNPFNLFIYLMIAVNSSLSITWSGLSCQSLTRQPSYTIQIIAFVQSSGISLLYHSPNTISRGVFKLWFAIFIDV